MTRNLHFCRRAEQMKFANRTRVASATTIVTTWPWRTAIRSSSSSYWARRMRQVAGSALRPLSNPRLAMCQFSRSASISRSPAIWVSGLPSVPPTKSKTRPTSSWRASNLRPYEPVTSPGLGSVAAAIISTVPPLRNQSKLKPNYKISIKISRRISGCAVSESEDSSRLHVTGFKIISNEMRHI